MELLKTTPGIIPTFNGGLGNQYFQLVAAYLAAKYAGCPLFIPRESNRFNPHCKQKNKYNDTIFSTIGTAIPYITSDKFKREYLDPLKYTFHELRRTDMYSPYNPRTIRPGTILYSYFQYYPPIGEHEQEIRTLFTEPLAVRREALRQRGSHEHFAFLHIRRGDYVDNPATPIVGVPYYINAINLLLQSNPKVTKILVLSDDPKWVATQQMFQANLFELADYTDELDAMALMSICKGGAILANSTFSWWGAFLGPYETRAPIYYPKSWIPGPIVDLFPKEWIALPSA